MASRDACGILASPVLLARDYATPVGMSAPPRQDSRGHTNAVRTYALRALVSRHLEVDWQIDCHSMAAAGSVQEVCSQAQFPQI